MKYTERSCVITELIKATTIFKRLCPESRASRAAHQPSGVPFLCPLSQDVASRPPVHPRPPLPPHPPSLLLPSLSLSFSLNIRPPSVRSRVRVRSTGSLSLKRLKDRRSVQPPLGGRLSLFRMNGSSRSGGERRRRDAGESYEPPVTYSTRQDEQPARAAAAAVFLLSFSPSSPSLTRRRAEWVVTGRASLSADTRGPSALFSPRDRLLLHTSHRLPLLLHWPLLSRWRH